MLFGLWHASVGGADDEDAAVHLGGAGDHVLDEVGVPRAVCVGVVLLVRLVLQVSHVDGDPPVLLLRRAVDRRIVLQIQTRPRSIYTSGISFVLSQLGTQLS